MTEGGNVRSESGVPHTVAQWAECSLDSLPHHITSHYHPDNFQQTNHGWISSFPGFSSSSARWWLGVHLFLGLSLSCSPLGSLSKSTDSVQGPTVTSSALLSELRLRFSLLLPHPCRQLEGSLFWGSVRSLSQKANIDAIWGRSF